MGLFNLFISQRRQITVSFFKPTRILCVILASLLFSCTTTRRAPKNQPFVFATNVRVEGDMPKSEKTDLSARLSNQLDDSLRTQVRSVLGVWNQVVTPPVFDTTNLRRSIGFMVALLNASGYYNPIIKDSVRRDTTHRHNPKKREYRVIIDFTVRPGKQVKLDSISYNLSTPALQALTMQSVSRSLLKKGNPYSNAVLSAELDRLVYLFRNNGYYYFSKEDLVIVKDTVVAALIDPNLDPFQQAALLEELRKKREHPTINVEVQQRPPRDSSHLTKYTIGTVTVYPDLPLVLDDTVTVNNVDTSTARGFTIITRSNKFKPFIFPSNIRVRPGRPYKLDNATRTLNRFNLMGAWQQETIGFKASDSADSVLNATIRLYPAKKQSLSTDLEASRNTNDIVTTTNLFGMNVNLGLRNRNTFKQSVLTSTNLRGGIELGSDFIQTTQASLSHTISFPRPLLPFIYPFKRLFRMDSVRSVFTASASYVDRRQFFTVRSANASWGYEWTVRNKTYLWRPFNIEYTKLDKTDSFSNYLVEIPSLNLAFKSGLVLSQQFVYKSVKQHGNRTNFLTLSGESSGALLGLIRQLDEGDLWRFIKGEVDFRHHIDFRRSQLAFHAYGGAGVAYGREGGGWEQTLPFYKAFFAGGPNSMRGWQVRQLGLGSAKFYDTAKGGQLDRFGDIQLEGNVEYRFPLGTIFGQKILSALYVDAGNIWDRYPIDQSPEQKGSDFQLTRFYKELAVDAGTGLRIDFNYFLIRLDWAYKLKDPQRIYDSDKWFQDLKLFRGQFQLGIGYPF